MSYIQNFKELERPTIKEAHERLQNYIGNKILDRTTNKGGVGTHLEKLLYPNYFPNSSNKPDFIDGELKTITIVKKKRTKLFGFKETMAITMFNEEEVRKFSFKESCVFEKIKNLLLAILNEEAVLLYSQIKILDIDSELYFLLEKDYEFIRNMFCVIGKDLFSTSVEITPYLQIRTKGSKGSKKTYAFYLTKNFLDVYLKTFIEKINYKILY